MKYIVRIVVSALALIVATACYNNEIEKPNNPHNAGQCGLRITATIAKTRVSFADEDADNLYPKWQEGDILFGFYGDDPDGNGIILEVSSADDEHAELEIVSGNLEMQDLETIVYLIYTGKNGKGSITSTDKFTNGVFPLDLTSQDLSRIPVCMSAKAQIEGTADEKTLSFTFAYDCAILEIETIDGFGSDGFDNGALTEVKVSNLALVGNYSLNNDGELEITYDSQGGIQDYSKSLGYGWSTNSDGEIIHNGQREPILISTFPVANKDFTFSYTVGGSQGTTYYVTKSNKSLAKSNCYVLRHKYVAKTSDNMFFERVSDAFGHAADLFKAPDFSTAETNIVTLVRDCGLSGIDTDGPLVGESDPIDIDGYDVTLDLNGKTLELDGEECFQVESPSTFTIIDSSEGDGEITSLGFGMINNTGEVNIKGGNLHTVDWNVVENYGTLNVEGGEISSEGGYPIYNYGDANVEGGEIYSESVGAVANAGKLIISGGDITSDAVDEDNEAAITSLDGKLVIYGDCKITSTAYYAINVAGGEFTMDNGTVSGALGGIHLTDGSTGTIIGGSIESENGYALYVGNSTCTISGGTIKSKSTTKPAIYCFTEDEPDEDSPKNLIITWPDEDESDEGPLIVSTENHSTPYGPISTLDTDAGETNYAIVDISGGYLFSNDTAVFSKSATSSVSIANCYTNLGSMVSGGGATHSPYYANRVTQYIDSICLDPSPKKYGGYDFMFMITPSEGPDDPDDGGLTINPYTDGWGSSN